MPQVCWLIRTEFSVCTSGAWSTAPYLVKEHREGKKEKKSWYQYVFLGVGRENEDAGKGKDRCFPERDLDNFDCCAWGSAEKAFAFARSR